jgi:integrase/recombinase XerD
LEAAPGVKYKAALSVAYGAGLRVSEVVSLKVSDIDSKRMMLRVEQGKGGRRCSRRSCWNFCATGGVRSVRR